MNYSHQGWRVLTLLLALTMSVLACTANDTLFIRLTATPQPTIVPTALSIDTKFKLNDRVTIVGTSDSATVNLANNAGPFRAGQGTGACFANTSVPILDISKNIVDPNDEVIYYQVQCPGSRPGWIPQYILSRFTRQNTAVIKTADGQGAALYTSPDVNSLSPDLKCAEGASVRISTLRLSVNTADKNVYAQVTCDGNSGFVLEETLAPAS